MMSGNPTSFTVLPAMTKVSPLGNSTSTWVVSVMSRSVEILRGAVQTTRRGNSGLPVASISG